MKSRQKQAKQARRDSTGRFRPGVSGNPRGRAPKAGAKIDGWQSLTTGLGRRGFDKRTSVNMKSPVDVTPSEARDLWEGDDLAARIIESVPNEATREGWTLGVSEGDDPDEFKGEITDAWESLGVEEAIWEALAYERAYGGSAILLGANDSATDLTQPLDPDRVRSFDWLTVLERDDLSPTRWYRDPRAPKFGKPEVYRLNPSTPGGVEAEAQGMEIHESRLIIFEGIQVSRRTARSRNGWGSSLLTRIFHVLRDFNISWGAAGILVSDFAPAVFKMKGLAEALALDKNAGVINRMQALEQARSTARAVLIDEEEEFDRKQTPVTGLPELLDRFSTRLAAAADMPVTLLMGQSPAGLNATGESDIRFYYDRIGAVQRKKVKPAVKRITELLIKARGLPDDAAWAIKFNPLWQASGKEQAEERHVQAQSDQIYINTGVLSPEEVALSRFGGEEWSGETQVDFDARAKLEAEEPEPEQPPPTPPGQEEDDPETEEMEELGEGES